MLTIDLVLTEKSYKTTSSISVLRQKKTLSVSEKNLAVHTANTSSFSASIMLGLRTQFRSTLTGAVGKQQRWEYVAHMQVTTGFQMPRSAVNTINQSNKTSQVSGSRSHHASRVS